MPVLASSIYMNALPVPMLNQVFLQGQLQRLKTGIYGPQEGPVLGPKVSFLEVRMGSENGLMLDPTKLLLTSDPGPELALLHCKSADSPCGQDC